VKDKVDKGECMIEYCPTEKMLADFFTKPLQGSLFRTLRDVIMGYKDIDSLISFAFEERVENEEIGEDKNEKDESDETMTYADVVKRVKKVSFDLTTKNKTLEQCSRLKTRRLSNAHETAKTRHLSNAH
jgi:hypothetical protein